VQIGGSSGNTNRLREFAPAVNQTLDKYQINTPLRIAHFLAQIMHESGGFQYVKEIWGPNDWQVDYEGREDLGNTQPGDGKRFMGRGLIQLTGRANYKEFSKAMGVDFIAKPELVEQPPYAVLVAGWYWNSRDINQSADTDDNDWILGNQS
jgi:putative chitinase